MQNRSHPAAEWKPPSAIAGEIQVPIAIKAAILMLFAIQISTIPIGRSRSAFGNRNDFRK